MQLSFKENRPLIMGVINVTPDSFSDGGQAFKPEDAVRKAKKFISEGADIIDIGGESTGPGSVNISPEVELQRVLPVIKKIREFSDIPISVDTYKPMIADQALKLGADIINDVTAFRADPKMLNVVIKHDCPYIIMYSKDNTPRTTVKKKKYDNIIKTVLSFLEERIRIACSAGVKKDKIIVDPGLGQFISSIAFYSYEIIAGISELKKLKLPILIGASRKSFLLGSMNTRNCKGEIISAIAYINGASIIRTHDVKGSVELFNNLR